MTVGTLIESRIRAEVDAQLAGPSFVRRLVRPIEETSRKIDIPGQIETARDAFDRGQLLVLLPTRQAESLDETLTLSDGDEVTFLRLVPLIGG